MRKILLEELSSKEKTAFRTILRAIMHVGFIQGRVGTPKLDEDLIKKVMTKYRIYMRKI